MDISIGDCRYVLHAEGPTDGVDEFEFQLTEEEWEPRYPIEGAEVCDLEPREEGTRRIEVTGECYSVEEAFLNPRGNPGVASLMDSSRKLHLQIEIMGEDGVDLLLAEHYWYWDGRRMEAEVQELVRNEWYDADGEMENYASFEEYAKADHLPECMTEEDWMTPGYYGYRPWFDDDNRKIDELGSWHHLGNGGPTSVGPRNRKIRVFIEDEISEVFGKDGNLALVQERRICSGHRPWIPSTLVDNFGYQGGLEWKIRRDAIEWDGATSESIYDEAHLIQSYVRDRDARDWVSWERLKSAVPSGRKQLWSEIGDLIDRPGRTFVNVVLAYDPDADEPIHIRYMLAEANRAMKTIHKDGLANLGEVAYVRVVQRKATDKDDVGAHVSVCELTPEFAKEWGYSRDEWYGRPSVVSK